jgi:peptide chain release factor subunit 1
MANDLLVPERHTIDGVLVGGPSPTKDEFLDGDYLHHELQDEVVGKFDVAYTDESGLYDLVDAASEVLAEREILQDKQVMEEFFEQLHDGDLATYGFEATRENLVIGAVDRLLISEDLRKDVVTYECGEGHEEQVLLDSSAETPTHTCSRCGETTEEGDREDAIDHLMSIAGNRGTETVFVSTDFEKGDQLLTAFGGVAGLLRYATNI